MHKIDQGMDTNELFLQWEDLKLFSNPKAKEALQSDNSIEPISSETIFAFMASRPEKKKRTSYKSFRV